MHSNSSPVTSTQACVHEQLRRQVEKHAQSIFRKPIMPHNRAAFAASMEAWRNVGHPPLILDAGCGVGLSTLHLARAFPGHFVIGVDQSAHRLARQTRWEQAQPDNFTRVRADLVDYWRLLQENEVRLARHYILYPNPWPKLGHLGRRWHGHPVFPTVVALGGELECRSNWRIYIEEMAQALQQLGGREVLCEPFTATKAITPFEQKYSASGHMLWRCTASLTGA